MIGSAVSLRNLISFGATFKLKVKTAEAAHARALGFLRAFTPFAGWKELELRVRPPVRSKAQTALYEWLRKPPPGVHWVDFAKQTFDRAALEARRIELDEVGLAALERFGPARFTSQESSEAGPWCALTWELGQQLVPDAWLAFGGEHAARTVDGFAQVSVFAATGDLELLEPSSRAPLPFQHESHYPTWSPGSYRLACHGLARLYLPRRDLTVNLRLPFEEPDADFRAYVAALDAALGQPLSRKHWKAVLASKRGDSQYERKLAF